MPPNAVAARPRRQLRWRRGRVGVGDLGEAPAQGLGGVEAPAAAARDRDLARVWAAAESCTRALGAW